MTDRTQTGEAKAARDRFDRAMKTDPAAVREVDRVLRRRSTDFPIARDATSGLPPRSSILPPYPWTEIGEKERRGLAFMGEADTHIEEIIDRTWWQRLAITKWEVTAFMIGVAIVPVTWWFSR